jgi:hypothetical protein
VVLAIEVEGEVAGVLMVGEEEEPDYRCVSIDLGLNAAHQGRDACAGRRAALRGRAARDHQPDASAPRRQTGRATLRALVGVGELGQPSALRARPACGSGNG